VKIDPSKLKLISCDIIEDPDFNRRIRWSYGEIALAVLTYVFEELAEDKDALEHYIHSLIERFTIYYLEKGMNAYTLIFLNETEASIWFRTEDGHNVNLPKSQIEVDNDDAPLQPGEAVDVNVPDWLAEKENL